MLKNQAINLDILETQNYQTISWTIPNAVFLIIILLMAFLMYKKKPKVSKWIQMKSWKIIHQYYFL